MEQERLIAKTMQGLEPVLADELRALGAEGVEEGCRMVSFLGDKRMMYRANFFLRTAIRILKPLFSFEARTPEEVYGASLSYDWSGIIDPQKRFAVDSVVNSELFKHSGFVALRLKDAIVDQQRNAYGRRPYVDTVNPHIRIHLHIQGSTCSVLLDSSGDSLHMRGYRVEQNAAPLNEVLAAGLILLSGWDMEEPFLDPLCGSGTLPIEAALIAKGIAPGLFRKHFGFENWADFDPDMYAEIYNDDSMETDREPLIIGSDVSTHAVEMAMMNVTNAGLAKSIRISRQSVFDSSPSSKPGVVITNPPYGERVKQFQLDNFYRQLGDTFKQRYAGWNVWMITGNRQVMKSFGLHPSKTITLFNGPIECKFQRFSMYVGSKGGDGDSLEMDR